MLDEKKQKKTDNSKTIIGKRASQVRSDINSYSSDIASKKNKSKSQKKSGANVKENEFELSSPVQFSKDDILGSNSNRLNNINPYDDLADANTHGKYTTARKKTTYRVSKAKQLPIKEITENFKNKYIKNTLSAFSDYLKAKRLYLILIFLVIFFSFSILYIICSASLPADVIARNVYIESLNVGGMTYDEALKAVKETTLFSEQTVTLKCEGQTFEINGMDIGLTASPEETTQKAFNYTKSTDKFSNGLKAVALLFHRHTVVPVANINEVMLEQKLMDFGTQVCGERVGHYVEVLDNNQATVWPGHSGFDGNIEKAKRKVFDAFSREQFSNISVTFDSIPPDDITFEQFYNAVFLEPTNAYYEVKDNSVNIIPEVNGRYADENTVTPLLAEVKEGRDPVSVPWETSYAELNSETLKTRLFKDVLASYSTDYSTSTANRCANISRAAQLLNGAIIPSGNIFSFNNRVGERTKYNGFYTAPEYSDGQTVEGIGGGTCQVSTTLYSAVLYAGLDIISRTNHMFSVSYAPLGQDATVSDTGIDFQFRNNYDYPVKIASFVDGSKIYVQIMGTAWEPTREYKIDNTVSYTSGGISVYSQRYTYEEGVCVSTEKLPSSYYKNQE